MKSGRYFLRYQKYSSLRSNDLRTKNIIILRASWRGNQKETWKKAVLRFEAPYASTAWLFFNESWWHIPIRIAISFICFPFLQRNHELHILHVEENRFQQIERWLFRRKKFQNKSMYIRIDILATYEKKFFFVHCNL